MCGAVPCIAESVTLLKGLTNFANGENTRKRVQFQNMTNTNKWDEKA